MMLSTLPAKHLRGFGSSSGGGPGGARGYILHSTRASPSQFPDIHSPSSVFKPLSPAAAHALQMQTPASNQGKNQSLSHLKMRSPGGDRSFAREERSMYRGGGSNVASLAMGTR
jgi:hypothetical protein